jgi:hypothetical protein
MAEVRRVGNGAEQPVNRAGLLGQPVLDFLRAGRAALAFLTASCKRAAAFPVGAARAIRKLALSACSSSNASSRTTVRVLPVPGPPEMMHSLFRMAANAATICQSTSAAASAEKSRDKPSPRSFQSTCRVCSLARRLMALARSVS